MTLGDKIDNLIIRLAKWRIRKQWGTCMDMDYNHFKTTPRLNAKGRCGSCQATEVTEWLNKWKELNDEF